MSRSSSSSRSRSEKEDKKRKKREKDDKKKRNKSSRTRSRSAKKDKKDRKRSISEDKRKKKSKRSSPSEDRKKKKRSSPSVDKKKKRSSPSPADRKDKKKSRSSRSKETKKKRDSEQQNESEKKGTQKEKEKAPVVVELTEEEKKQLELKKQRERLAKIRMMKYTLPESDEDEEDKNIQTEEKPKTTTANTTENVSNVLIQKEVIKSSEEQVVQGLNQEPSLKNNNNQLPIEQNLIVPEIEITSSNNAIIQQNTLIEEEKQLEMEEPLAEETVIRMILQDSDGLEDESDDEENHEGKDLEEINVEKIGKIDADAIKINKARREQLEKTLMGRRDEESDIVASVFDGDGSSSKNIPASNNGSQLSMKKTTFDFDNKKLNQQLETVAVVAEDSEEEEDELDAYCRQLEEQLENSKPTQKGKITNSSSNNGNNNGMQGNGPSSEIPQQNFITMEEIFGKGYANDDDEEDLLDDDDELEEFAQMKKNQEAAEAAEQDKMQIEKEESDDEDEDDDEHYRAFQEAMRKKKEELNKDNTGDLMIDDEAEIEDKVIRSETIGEGENKEDYLERLKREASRKELKPVVYKLEDLEPFRKNFYIESKEIASMTEEEVKQYRENLGDIQVKGADVPRPIKTWFQCGLSDKILHVLVDKKKYDKPFPIQCQSLPVIMNGRDTLGIAETGSGKTLAYILPMIRHIADQRPLEEGDGPIGLILVPTRELATQIYLEARPFLKPYSFDIVAVFGGTGIKGQLSELKRGCEIVVCTPGRLIDVLTTSNGKITNLKRVTMVVIDEADRMFDLGFEPQISKILATTRPDKQTALFSATFPKNVESLSKKLMKNRPCEIIVGARGQACTNITQIVEIRDESTRLYRLLELLGIYTEKGQVIIFVDKQNEVDALYTVLRSSYYKPTILHAGVDAEDRTNNLQDFRKGIYKILIATSVSSRGIDVKNVVLVVNYKCPNHIEDYIHRIGRTGRAGNKGTAVTFLSPDEDKYSLDLIKALKRSDQKVPQELLEMGEEFKKKLKTGEAKVYRDGNIKGSGFSFDEEELSTKDKEKFEQKKLLAITMGLDIEEKEDEDIFIKKGFDDDKKEKKEKKPELTFQQKLNLVMTQEEYQELKEQLLSESTKMANQKQLQGQGEESIKKATEEIFRKGLENFKPTAKNVEVGKIEIAKMLQQFEKNNEEANNQIVAELEINDYPENSRKYITRRDFLDRIFFQTGCTIIQRGELVEVGKKVKPGFHKLYLRIEGDSEHKVRMAYKDIKTELEERSIRMHERNQHAGKFTIP